jgi:hypothetical protein
MRVSVPGSMTSMKRGVDARTGARRGGGPFGARSERDVVAGPVEESLEGAGEGPVEGAASGIGARCDGADALSANVKRTVSPARSSAYGGFSGLNIETSV